MIFRQFEADAKTGSEIWSRFEKHFLFPDTGGPKVFREGTVKGIVPPDFKNDFRVYGAKCVFFV